MLYFLTNQLLLFAWKSAFVHFGFVNYFEVGLRFMLHLNGNILDTVPLCVSSDLFSSVTPTTSLSNTLFSSSYVSLGCKNCIHNLKMLAQNGSETSLNVIQGQNYRMNTCPDVPLNLSLEQTDRQL